MVDLPFRLPAEILLEILSRPLGVEASKRGSEAEVTYLKRVTVLRNYVQAFQLGEEVARVHGCFSSQSFWKAGSARKGSQIGSSFKTAGVTGVPL
jgi:hypothetical protein